MFYYVDTEFNGFEGEWVSIAFASEGRQTLYIVNGKWEFQKKVMDPWVKKNVYPILFNVPPSTEQYIVYNNLEASRIIEEYLREDPFPVFVADWPEDFIHLNKLFIVGPGNMIKMSREAKFLLSRGKYNERKLQLEGTVVHNAAWDALNLKLNYLNDVENGK